MLLLIVSRGAYSVSTSRTCRRFNKTETTTKSRNGCFSKSLFVICITLFYCGTSRAHLVLSNFFYTKEDFVLFWISICVVRISIDTPTICVLKSFLGSFEIVSVLFVYYSAILLWIGNYFVQILFICFETNFF